MRNSKGNGYSSARFILAIVLSLITTSISQAQMKSFFSRAKQAVTQSVSPASYNAPGAKMSNVAMPQVNMPQVNMPQVNMPQVNMPQVNMPQFATPKLPQFNTQAIQNPLGNLPTMQQVQKTGLGGMVEKCNQTARNFLNKTKEALTIPKFNGFQQTSSNSPAGSLMNLLPFGKSKNTQTGLRSILPGLTQQQVPAQPPTLQNWLGQPRPQ